MMLNHVTQNNQACPNSCWNIHPFHGSEPHPKIYKFKSPTVSQAMAEAGGLAWDVIKAIPAGMAAKDHALMQVGHLLGGPAPALTREETIAGVNQACDQMAAPLVGAVGAVAGGVHSGLHTLTGSEVSADLLTDPVMILATDGLLKGVPKVSRKLWDVTGSGLQKLSQFELTFDPYTMNSNGFGGVKFGKKAPSISSTGESATVSKALADSVKPKVHGNSLKNKKPTHIYKLDKDKQVYKIGESSQGLDKSGLSKRAQQQARRLQRGDPDSFYESKLLRTYPDKATARKFETKLIKKLKAENPDALPGNKNNR